MNGCQKNSEGFKHSSAQLLECEAWNPEGVRSRNACWDAAAVVHKQGLTSIGHKYTAAARTNFFKHKAWAGEAFAVIAEKENESTLHWIGTTGSNVETTRWAVQVDGQHNKTLFHAMT